MKTAFKITLCALLAVTVFADVPKELEIGSKAPKAELKMIDISGKAISLNDVKGRNGLLVVFTCNTCPYVLAWEERINLLADKCKDMGVGIIGVNSNEAQRETVDSYEAMKKHATEKSFGYSYVVDRNSEMADAFGANRTPQIFLFDKNMTLVYRGAVDDNRDNPDEVKEYYAMNAVDELVAGKPISTPVTKSVGCSIKRMR